MHVHGYSYMDAASYEYLTCTLSYKIDTYKSTHASHFEILASNIYVAGGWNDFEKITCQNWSLSFIHAWLDVLASYN